MKCDPCSATLKRRTASKNRPYHYTLSGLENLFLCGIDVMVCPNCSIESPQIPQLKQLHRTIAEMLLRKARALTGREIRFLRKNAGLPARKFATLLQVSPEHLSRVENGHYKSLGRSTDQLVRVLASLTLLDEPGRDSLLEVADLFESRTPLPRKRVFRLSRNKWKAAA